MENPIKMDDLGVPLFLGNIHLVFKGLGLMYFDALDGFTDLSD